MELNKKETSAENYTFTDDKYNCHYTKSIYYSIWRKCLELILDFKTVYKKSILEIGCGVGQFANMLLDNKLDYIGFDFSEIAIKKSKQTNKNGLFFNEDARLTNLYTFKNFDIYILLEVLEHIKQDKLIISKIISGKYVLFSLPNFDCDTHVRLFKSKEEIIERYKFLINISNIYEFKLAGHIFWLCEGIKK